MKKRLFWGMAALVVLTLSSCQKDFVVNEVDNAIGFGTYLGRDAQTKASVANLEAMKAVAYPGFGVFAFYTGTNSFAATNVPNFMYNQNVDYATEWDYNPKKYWPGGDNKVSFFAYAPYTTIGATAPTTNITQFSTEAAQGAPSLTFVQSDVSSQIDLLYATPIKDKTSGDVAFVFNHALSRIGFKVKTERTDYKVAVKKITLSSTFNTSGVMSLENGNFTSTTATTSKSYTLNYPLDNYISSTTGEIITANEGYMMIIPTDCSSEANKVSVTVEYLYQYEYAEDNYATAVETSATGSVKVEFTKGKAYTLILTLDPLSSIVFADPTVTPWNPESGEDTTVS